MILLTGVISRVYFYLSSQGYWDRIWNLCNTDQDKMIAEDEWINTVVLISCGNDSSHGCLARRTACRKQQTLVQKTIHRFYWKLSGKTLREGCCVLMTAVELLELYKKGFTQQALQSTSYTTLHLLYMHRCLNKCWTWQMPAICPSYTNTDYFCCPPVGQESIALDIWQRDSSLRNYQTHNAH